MTPCYYCGDKEDTKETIVNVAGGVYFLLGDRKSEKPGYIKVSLCDDCLSTQVSLEKLFSVFLKRRGRWTPKIINPPKWHDDIEEIDLTGEDEGPD